MKHLKLFENTASYEAWKNSEEYVLPNVSYVEETKGVAFNPNVASANLIEFTINGAPYQAEEGMTWQEFVESSYNDGSVDVNTKYGYIRHNGNYLSSPESGYTMEDDAIISGFDYQYLDM